MIHVKNQCLCIASRFTESLITQLLYATSCQTLQMSKCINFQTCHLPCDHNWCFASLWINADTMSESCNRYIIGEIGPVGSVILMLSRFSCHSLSLTMTLPKLLQHCQFTNKDSIYKAHMRLFSTIRPRTSKKVGVCVCARAPWQQLLHQSSSSQQYVHHYPKELITFKVRRQW